MSSTFSPGRSPVSSRLQQLGGVGGVSRLRSSSLKKPPEPLTRAVADCLSSSVACSHHGGPSSSFPVSEPARILRDYLASPLTMDLAYSVILEHTISERERSPAVVARCVALLKRYLLRYKPSEETLLQIDRFCVNTISECDITPYQRLSPWSRSLNQQSGTSATSTSISPLPVASFASVPLVKSLKYVRSLVAQHVPKRSFQRASFTASAPSSARQSLPSLSSLLSKSFNSQLNPANNGESSDNKDTTALPASNLSHIEEDIMEDHEYVALDVLKWRWLGECQSSLLPIDSDRSGNSQVMRTHNLLEVGAASLLLGDMEAKMTSRSQKSFGTADMPYLDQLLQPSPITTITNSASARPHLRAITTSKRTKPGSHQIWEDSPVSTFRPRARPLFQYRHYSEQQPLRLNPAEVCEVIAAVCSETSSPNANSSTVSSRLSINSGKPSMDVAVSVLIKLVIDMYVMDSTTAAPLTLSMLEEMIGSPRSACRVRAFDLILNLGVHAHLLEPIITDASAIEEEYSAEEYLENEAQFSQEKRESDPFKNKSTTSAINYFESWILNILYEILLLLVQIEEKEESVWASGLSCLLYFVCDRGKILRKRLKGLDIRVVKAFLETSRKNSWAEIVHCRLTCLLTNMFYEVLGDPTEASSKSPVFLVDQLELVGGTDFIFLEYSLASSREERRYLFLVLFDYVVHHINRACLATGVLEYTDEEIQPLVTLLTVAGAPEALYISIKLGVEGVGEILTASISNALSRYPNSKRLNMLSGKTMEKFKVIISSFSHVDKEFLHMIQITKSLKFFDSIQSASLRNDMIMKSKLSWATLHSLLHSDRISYRRNGYVWLGDLLIAEISEEQDTDIWSNVKKLQQRIAHAGGLHDSSETSDIPSSIWLMCGLLKSKTNYIRWGFLFVLERLLMRCKLLLDESEMQNSGGDDLGHEHEDSRLEKANAVIDIMSSALLLVINETDRINILKMCDLLFSQLCLRVPSAAAMKLGARVLGNTVEKNKRIDTGTYVSQTENCHWGELNDEADSRYGHYNPTSLSHKTASMAALLLQGQAIVPMQLVSRVPAALFYWPLMQLASAATDDIALGVAVGSQGRGNLPGATSDIRATLLLLLIAKCTSDPAAVQDVDGEQFFREFLDDTDSRVAYYSSAFLLKRMMTEKAGKYQQMLQNLVVKAQQSNNEKLLENPYLQMRGILKLASDMGTEL